VSADYIGDNKDYLGQTTTMQAAAKLNPDLKQSALDNFTPGYNKQLEFVKKYQPKLITVMGGGNDVGFSDVLRYCASPNLIDNTCSYTIEGTKLHKMLQDSIITQYFINKRLISDIKKYSPTSRIAIIGYPSFIATDTLTLDNFRFCGIDGGLLNQRERKMINGRLHDFNVMLKQLAHDMYVSFVDLEKSLNGGRICEGNAYMNDIWDTGGPTKAGNNPATFHPNDLGHRKMQEAIIASDVFNHKAVPDSQGINYEEKMRKRTEQASIAEIAGSTFRIITHAS
jgi:lysophospholipase L1-like esterase